MQLFSLLFLAIMTFVSPANAEELPTVPVELVQAFHQRNNFQSASFAYRIIEEKKGRPFARVTNMEQLSVGDDLMQINKDDDDGIREYEPTTDRPWLGVHGACRSNVHLINRTAPATWSQLEGQGFALLRNTDDGTIYQDARLVGLAPQMGQNRSFTQFLDELQSLPMQKWGIRRESNYVTVTGWLNLDENSARAYEWKLDSEREMAVIEVASVSKNNGAERRSIIAENEYKKVGDRWWPSKTTMKYRDLTRTFEYGSVLINDASHPKKLTPDAMGLPVGAHVRVANGQGLELRRYAGEGETMSEEEFQAKVAEPDFSTLGLLCILDNYRIKLHSIGPGMYPDWWNQDSTEFGLSDRKHDLDAWEAYVRRWKLRHTIDVPNPIEQKQVTAADALLKQCRDRAQNIMKRDEKSKVDKATTDKKLAGIFDELKKRLDGILASSQTADVKADVLPHQTGDR